MLAKLLCCIVFANIGYPTGHWDDDILVRKFFECFAVLRQELCTQIKATFFFVISQYLITARTGQA